MKETLVSLEIAKLAKEKGFNWECDFRYSIIPQNLLQKWLRDVHNIYLWLTPGGKKWSAFYCIEDPSVTSHRLSRIKGQNTYEEALEIGLLESLKLI